MAEIQRSQPVHNPESLSLELGSQIPARTGYLEWAQGVDGLCQLADADRPSLDR